MIQFGDDDTDDGSSSLRNLLQGVWFLTRTTYIAASEYIKYRAGFKSHNEMIKSIAIRLSHENMFYIKMFQAFAANQNMLNDELSAFFIKFPTAKCASRLKPGPANAKSLGFAPLICPRSFNFSTSSSKSNLIFP